MNRPAKIFIVLFAGCLASGARPAAADLCDDKLAQADKTWKSAQQAAASKDFESARARFNSAAIQYTTVSRMDGCRSTDVPNTARENAAKARKHADESVDLADNVDKGKTYDQGKSKFQQGMSLLQRGEYRDAAEVFDQAADLFDEAAEVENHNAKLAKSNAQQARNAAEDARRRADRADEGARRFDQGNGERGASGRHSYDGGDSDSDSGRDGESDDGESFDE